MSTTRLTAVLLVVTTGLLAPTTGPFADASLEVLLPAGASVLSHARGDLDGDGRPELVLVWSAGDLRSVASFKARDGRWSPWLETDGGLLPAASETPHAVGLADATGDGRPELAIHSLVGGRSAMSSRFLAYAGPPDGGPRLVLLLKGLTSPPGYPLLGTESGTPSVTFLDAGTTAAPGHREVHCWRGDRFELCREVPWPVR